MSKDTMPPVSGAARINEEGHASCQQVGSAADPAEVPRAED